MPWATTARADRMAQRMDRAHAGAARLADAGQVRRHEHLRAGLDVRAVVDGAREPRPAVRMTWSAIASANGFGLRDRSDSSEWVIASTPVAAVASGGRPDGQLRVEDRGDRQDARVADVGLSTGDLVGDDAEGIRLRSRTCGRRDGDDRQTRQRGPRGDSRARARRRRSRRGARRPSRRPSRSRRRPGGRPCHSGPRSPARRSPARREAVPGFGSTPSKTGNSMPAAASTPTTRSMTPDRTTPRSVTTKARVPPASRDEVGEPIDRPRPRTGPDCAGPSRTTDRRARQADLRGRCRSRCRGGPSASAGSRRRGTSARSSGRRGCRRSRPRRSRARRGP